VCLVVFAKYVPDMEFMLVLISDEPPMTPDMSFYQRLLATDQDEAAELVEEYFKTHERDRVYDDVLLPALNYVKRDREDLSDEDAAFIVATTREIVDDVGSMQATVDAAAGNGRTPGPTPRARILACPARDDADELALLMLRQLLDPARFEMEILSPDTLSSELVAMTGRSHPAAVCIASVPPGGNHAGGDARSAQCARAPTGDDGAGSRIRRRRSCDLRGRGPASRGTSAMTTIWRGWRLRWPTRAKARAVIVPCAVAAVANVLVLGAAAAVRARRYAWSRVAQATLEVYRAAQPARRTRTQEASL
jgi:hypothetical protein